MRVNLAAVGASLVGALVVACSSSGSSDDAAAAGNGGNGGSGGSGALACALTLPGALTGSYGCTVAAVYLAKDDTASIAFIIPSMSPSLSPSLAVAIVRSGRMSTGAWAPSDPGCIATIEVTTGPSAWLATIGPAGALGTFSAMLTSVTSVGASPQGEAYAIHGTLSASLAAVDGSHAGGEVRMAFSF